MKTYSKNKKGHARRSFLVMSLSVLVMIISSWGLYVTVFRPSDAASEQWQARVVVSSPVYIYQPFSIKGTIISYRQTPTVTPTVTSTTPPTTPVPNAMVFLSLENKANSYKQSVVATIDSEGRFEVPDASVTQEGTYSVRVWRDQLLTNEIIQTGGPTSFTTKARDPLIASISARLVDRQSNRYIVEGTIAKVDYGNYSGYVTPISIYFSNKLCQKSPISVNVTAYFSAALRANIGKFSQQFTWDGSCGGFWVRPFYKQQWLLDSNSSLAEYFTTNLTPTPTPTVVCGPKLRCNAAPEGCYYSRASNCSCGVLVCPTITPTTTITSTVSVPPPSCTKPPCATPPNGCKYIGATECSCGTLVCN